MIEETNAKNIYSLKELRKLSTERLIGMLTMHSSSLTKTARKREDNIFKVLSERKVIDYEAMKHEYARIGMW